MDCALAPLRYSLVHAAYRGALLCADSGLCTATLGAPVHDAGCPACCTRPPRAQKFNTNPTTLPLSCASCPCRRLSCGSGDVRRLGGPSPPELRPVASWRTQGRSAPRRAKGPARVAQASVRWSWAWWYGAAPALFNNHTSVSSSCARARGAARPGERCSRTVTWRSCTPGAAVCSKRGAPPPLASQLPAEATGDRPIAQVRRAGCSQAAPTFAPSTPAKTAAPAKAAGVCRAGTRHAHRLRPGPAHEQPPRRQRMPGGQGH